MQQITPTVSIAAITYNMQQYLPQLLDSILMQKTNFSFEIVVDDDHSPDPFCWITSAVSRIGLFCLYGIAMLVVV